MMAHAMARLRLILSEMPRFRICISNIYIKYMHILIYIHLYIFDIPYTLQLSVQPKYATACYTRWEFAKLETTTYRFLYYM